MGNLPVPVGLTDDIRNDIAAVGRIAAVPAILRLVCQSTGMGFSAVARVTDDSWTACATHDEVQFGLQPGGQLPLQTTLCFESRAARQPIVIDDFDMHPLYRAHHTPRIYGLKSYISVPIVLPDGTYFGNLCAIDARPASVSNSRTLAMFESFASLIAAQLASDDVQRGVSAALSRERENSALREQFIAVLGHDLRNPLSAISSTAQVLALRKDDPALAKMGQRLTSSVQRMSRLIDDVMDFARGRLGTGIPVNKTVEADLATPLRAAVLELIDSHPGRKVVDDIVIDSAVSCDRERLQQLVSNLVANALIYGSADAPVLVHARVKGEQLVLAVSNEGEPIPPESLLRVFEPYWRSEKQSPGGGLGLGLYICNEIVKAHGGKLEVCSSGTEGTCFSATLPTS